MLLDEVKLQLVAGKFVFNFLSDLSPRYATDAIMHCKLPLIQTKTSSFTNSFLNTHKGHFG